MFGDFTTLSMKGLTQFALTHSKGTVIVCIANIISNIETCGDNMQKNLKTKRDKVLCLTL